jgi:predicted nuclease with TOPRIM domain
MTEPTTASQPSSSTPNPYLADLPAAADTLVRLEELAAKNREIGGRLAELMAERALVEEAVTFLTARYAGLKKLAKLTPAELAAVRSVP